MGEEAADDYDLELQLPGDNDEEDRVMEWEAGLPGPDELTSLSQPLVPPGLAAVFRIQPEPGRTLLDVHRASAATVSRLRRGASSSSSSSSSLQFHQTEADQKERAEEEKESALAAAAGGGMEKESNKSSKKRGAARLVWTPQLHKRFVDVVAHLGLKNAVPKSIMELMNVEGLTRENVASHLQKYRLYVKRMQGLSNEGPSDHHIFASTPVPHPHHHEVVPAPPSSSYAAAMYHHHHGPMVVGINSSYHQHHQQPSGYGVSSSSSYYQYHYANK